MSKTYAIRRIGKYIADHEIHGNILLPGTFFLMMALKGAQVLNMKNPAISDVDFQNFLVLSNEGKEVSLHTVFSDLERDKKSFTISSAKAESHDNWICHISGSLLTEKSNEQKTAETLSNIRRRCHQAIAIDVYYRQTRERGFMYGPTFQGIKSLYLADEDEAIGEIELLPSLKVNKKDQLMHPAMLDACLQLTGAIIPADIINDPGASFIDVGVEKVQFYHEVPENIWCHARLRSDMNAHQDRQLAIDFTIMNSLGDIIADIIGFLIKVSLGGRTKTENLQTNLEDNFYTVDWHKQKDKPVVSEKTDKAPGVWVIFGDMEGVGLSIAQRIQEHGENCVMVSSGEKFTYADQTGMHHYTVNPLHPDDFKDLLNHIDNNADNENGWRRIIHLWSTDEQSLDDPGNAQPRICASVLHLVQAVIGMEWQIQPKLWMFTKGAQKVLESDIHLNPAQATLWGLNNVIANEYPDLDSVMIDLDASDEMVHVDTLLSELFESGKENQVAFRGINRYVARFVRIDTAQAQSDQKLDLQSDGTYLITGGLGGLGIALCGWLVENGVQHLALIGRHAASDEAADVIEKMRSHGINISVYQADVSVWEEIKVTFDKMAASMRPLKGVFHLAGVLDDANLADQDWSRFEYVMRPKIAGAWHLHQLTTFMDLSHFVLFSSVASMFGTHGQGNHAAANAFLDSLAYYRRSHGQKAVCLNWGVWSEIGSAVNTRLQNRLARHGVKPVTVRQGLTLLEHALLHNFARAAIISIDWNIYCGLFSKGQTPRFFSELSANNQTKIVDEWDDISIRLKNTSNLQLCSDLLKNYLKHKIAETLQMDAEMIEDQSDLIQLGMDSLIFIDLSHILSQDLGIQIVPHEVFENPRIDAMTQLFLKSRDNTANNDVVVSDNVADHEFIAVIEKNNIHEPFGLMDMQQAYLVGQSGAMELGNVSCHVYTEVESEVIDLERYETAWQKLIERHGMLRAVFLSSGKQKILAEVPSYRINVTDMRDIGRDERQSRLLAIRRRMSHQIMDVEKWPLFEVRASRLKEARVRLHISIDLLIADVHSIILMMQELMAFYHHPEQQLEPIDMSFRDYVLSERAFRNTTLYKDSRKYWLARLNTLPPAPDFQILKQTRDSGNSMFTRRKFTLPKEKWQSLKKHASAHGITPSLCLLAIYAKTISKWNTNPNFTINITLFNRMPVHPHVNNIVGDFTSVLLLAVENFVDESFASMAGRLRNQFWDDMKHRYFSGIEMLREIAKNSSVNVMPVVFTSQLGYGNIDKLTPEEEFPGEVIYGITQTPQVWLDNQSREENGDLVVFWDSVDAIFPEGFLNDMFDAYCRLIEALASETEAWEQPNFLDLLPLQQCEKRRVANNTQKTVTDDLLHTLFIGQAQKQPEHPAVVTLSRVLTYQDLMSYSGHIGRLLRDENARPGKLVAVLMEKGWEQVVAVLGILQAGAAYLPIDPALPDDRITYLLENSNANLVLSQSWILSECQLPSQTVYYAVDTLNPTYEDVAPLDVIQGPDDLAYVIYTSGTTGLPKGVMINHKGAVNTILEINDRYSVASSDKVLALANISFDLSVYDMFGTLAAGGTIIMPDADKSREPSHWEELVKLEGVTIWNSVPQMMQMFVDYSSGQQKDGLDQLRLVLLSGDWIPMTLPEKVWLLMKNARVVSLGGATEVSIWSVYYDINVVEGRGESIPYGRPLRNQSCYVLNEQMTDCPVLDVNYFVRFATIILSGFPLLSFLNGHLLF